MSRAHPHLIGIFGALRKYFTESQPGEIFLRKGREREDPHGSKGRRINFIHHVPTEVDLDLIPKHPGQMEFSIEGLRQALNLYIIFWKGLRCKCK